MTLFSAPENRILDAILSEGLGAGRTIAEEIIRDVKREARKGLAPPELMLRVRRVLLRYEPLLSRTLSDTLLASWLAGATEIPREPVYPVLAYLPPPNVPDAPIAAFGEGESPVSFPILEKAAKDLLERRVLLKSEFSALTQDAKRAAFTVARVGTLDALEKVQAALAEGVGKGGSLRTFANAIGDVVESSSLSPAHVENVFRTNTAAANSAGLLNTLSDPIVQDEFPYLAYYATHDGRTRPEHLALEKLGLSGTNIYRIDDPIWQEFMPPWGYS